MLFFRQLAVLVWKNILVTLVRHPVTTTLRALLLPVVFAWFMAYVRTFFVPYATFGIGSAGPIHSLQDALHAVGGGRNTLAFVRGNFTGGSIDRIITQLGDVARAAGTDVQILDQEDDLLTLCRSSLMGASQCIAAITFHSSPTEGPWGRWNYTVRADGGLNAHIDVTSRYNDQEIYVLPLQHALDYAIADLDATVGAPRLPEVEEYPYTTLSQEERATQIRLSYMNAVISTLGAAFFIGICGISYQQVGAQATEREMKMAQLLEAMMPNTRRWQPQAARLLSYMLAFSLVYLPGWLIMAGILKAGVFQQTSAGILIVLHLLTGLSLSSSALFIAAFFRKAQLSGITAILVNLALAIVAQTHDAASTSSVAVLTLLFPSMNYTYFISLMARYEVQNLPTNLVQAAPSSPSKLPGIAMWAFLLIQIIVYPILGALVERLLWGTASGGRQLRSAGDATAAVELKNFSKHFRSSWIQRRVLPIFGRKGRETVVAVDGLNVTVLPGQLTVLLGANGSGKSTTLDAIAGLSPVTAGTISLDFSRGLGLCPQQNVLWKDLTVYEHVVIFNRLKAVGPLATKQENLKLIGDCDLASKVDSKAGKLSGGQMRKLQLSIMFTGDSRICLIDEVSSGIDALARRRIQDILLAERSRSNRSMIFTTHFLDEAETVADHLLIMSKGKLRVSGTAPEIKQSGVYRVHLQRTAPVDGGKAPEVPRFDGVKRQDMPDQTIYEVPSAGQAADILAGLEKQTLWNEYHVSGPTLEDVFLRVAEEMNQEGTVDPASDERSSDEEGGPEKMLRLHSGSNIGAFKQGYVLFRKRATVFRRNPLPNLVAAILPIVTAALVALLLSDYTKAGCTPRDQVSTSYVADLQSRLADRLHIVVGPSSRIGLNSLSLLASSLSLGGGSNNSTGAGLAKLTKAIHTVDTIGQFNDYIASNPHNVTPGGFFLGDGSGPATLAFQGNGAVSAAVVMQNVLDVLLTNTSIATQYQTFNIPWQANQGNTLQFCIYFGLVMSVAPVFFALYPTVERLRQVRGLQYSNGVRALALWQAYLAFDLLFIVVGSVLSTILLGARSSAFFDLGLLFLVMLLYTVASTILAYVVSLFVKSQLAAFAVTTAYNAVSFLIYFIAYLSTFTYAPVNRVDDYEAYVYFALAIPFPTASLLRSFFVSLNILSINCRGSGVYVSSGSEMLAYGGPITYLVIQSLVLFAFLVWWDSGSRFGALFRRKTYRENDGEEKAPLEPEVAAELARVQSSSDDGLRVLHLSKAYGKNLAVDDVSFGVQRGEVFALLGPNGAGKSTTISVVRGDLRPSNNGGDVFIENTSLVKHRSAARQHLGVCPQFDAMDQMTTVEHLRFYARIRGVKDVEGNVREVVRAVGLAKFQSRMAASLSGGNRRKLSLGIALMGNPTVILLDEPSSGMDVAAKRTMWQTLRAVLPGRSIVLTTHSMEEADALASRAGILARRFLALGSSSYLRKKHGDRYHVHVVLRSAPHTPAEEAGAVEAWILSTFAGARVERIAHGQIRFSVPASSGGGGTGIAALFSTLERSKLDRGFDYYSVSQTTLDQVFLNVVGKHNVKEENYHENDGGEAQQGRSTRWWGLRKRRAGGGRGTGGAEDEAKGET